MKTRIIALEGIDGSGKTLQLNLLKTHLEGRGNRVLVKEFPVYTSFFGQQIGVLLKGDALRADQVDSKSMCLWFALDRFMDFKDFRDGDYDYLLINRYVLSNAVYQSVREIDEGIEDNWEWVKELEYGRFRLPMPDAYLVYDVDPVMAAVNLQQKGEREYMGEGGGVDAYEKQIGLQARARKRYLDLAQREESIDVINCMESGALLPPEDILRRAAQALALRGLVED